MNHQFLIISEHCEMLELVYEKLHTIVSFCSSPQRQPIKFTLRYFKRVGGIVKSGSSTFHFWQKFWYFHKQMIYSIITESHQQVLKVYLCVYVQRAERKKERKRKRKEVTLDLDSFSKYISAKLWMRSFLLLLNISLLLISDILFSIIFKIFCFY